MSARLSELDKSLRTERERVLGKDKFNQMVHDILSLKFWEKEGTSYAFYAKLPSGIEALRKIDPANMSNQNYLLALKTTLASIPTKMFGGLSRSEATYEVYNKINEAEDMFDLIRQIHRSPVLLDKINFQTLTNFSTIADLLDMKVSVQDVVQ